MKSRVLVGMSIVLLLATGCSETKSTNESKSDTTTVITEKTQEKEASSTTTVLQKASEAGQAMESGQVTIVTDTEMKIDEQKQRSQVTTTTQFTRNPLLAKTESTMVSNEQEVKTTSYLDEENLYMQMTGSTQWQKVNLAEQNIDPKQLLSSYSSSDIFQTLQEVQDKITMTEKDDNYLFYFSGKGDEVMALVESILGNSGQNSLSEEEDSELNFKNFTYQLAVSKDDLLPVSFEDNLEYETKSGDTSIKTVQKQEGTFEKINQIEGIVLPEEVQDTPE